MAASTNGGVDPQNLKLFRLREGSGHSFIQGQSAGKDTFDANDEMEPHMMTLPGRLNLTTRWIRVFFCGIFGFYLP